MALDKKRPIIKFFVPYGEKQEGAADFFFHMVNQWGGQKYDFVQTDDGRQSVLIIFWGWAYPPASKKFNRHARHNKKAQPSLWRLGGSAPLRLFLTGEASDFSVTPFLKYFFDYSVSFNPQSARNLFFSRHALMNYVSWSHSLKDFKDYCDEKRALYDQPKTRFCNYVFFHKGYDEPNRADFFKILSAYKRIDAPSRSCHNMDIELPSFIEDRGGKELLTFMSHYKFTIAFENQSLNHMDYFTEKIMQPFFARSVPIYYGCPNIERYFNPAAFINGHDYDSFEDLAARVRQVDQDDRLYQAYLNAHPILESSALYNIFKDIPIFAEKIVTRIEHVRHLKGSAFIVYRLKRALWGVILRIWYWGVGHWFQYKYWLQYKLNR